MNKLYDFTFFHESLFLGFLAKKAATVPITGNSIVKIKISFIIDIYTLQLFYHLIIFLSDTRDTSFNQRKNKLLFHYEQKVSTVTSKQHKLI